MTRRKALKGKKRPVKTGRKKRRRAEPQAPLLGLGEKVLCLDASSVCVGWAIFEDHELIEHGRYIQVGKHHGEKLLHYRRWLIDMFKRHKPAHVVTEAPYNSRRSHAFGVLSFYVAAALEAHFSVFGVELSDFNQVPAHMVKRLCEMKKQKDHEANKREGVRLANELYGLRLRYKEGDKTKKVSQDDQADAILLGHAWYIRTAGKVE